MTIFDYTVGFRGSGGSKTRLVGPILTPTAVAREQNLAAAENGRLAQLASAHP